MDYSTPLYYNYIISLAMFTFYSFLHYAFRLIPIGCQRRHGMRYEQIQLHRNQAFILPFQALGFNVIDPKFISTRHGSFQILPVVAGRNSSILLPAHYTGASSTGMYLFHGRKCKQTTDGHAK